jgi:hypothetical protein
LERNNEKHILLNASYKAGVWWIFL